MPQAWLVAWVALVPLFVTFERAAARLVTVAAVAYAVTLFEVDITTWVAPASARYFGLEPWTASELTVTAMGMLAAGYGLVLGTAVRLHLRSGQRLGVVWYGAVWCLWEASRMVVPPFLPTACLGSSQRAAPGVLQLASVTGIAGVTALVAATNAALARLWLARRPSPSLAVVAATILAVVVWGTARPERTTSAGPRVVLVDGDAAGVAESTLERYIAATRVVDAQHPALIIWPESALAVDPTRDAAAWDRLRGFVAELGIPVLTGGIGSALDADGGLVLFNSVHFVRPQHGMLSYHKQLLIPLAESWPAVLGTPPAGLDPVAAGGDFTLFGDATTRFGPLICFEITHARGAQALAARGARFLVNVNNDVWFGDREEPHWVWALIRAIESGRAVARASNRGTSAIIDPFGRVIVSARATDGPMALAGTIPDPVDTIYLRTGEVFLPACLLVVALGLVPRRSPLKAPGSMGATRRPP